MKILIRLGKCIGLLESSLYAAVRRYGLSCSGSYVVVFFLRENKHLSRAMKYQHTLLCGQNIRGIYTLSREATLLKLFCLPSEKRSILKGKNLLPLGANSFLLEKTSSQKCLGAQERKQEVTKVVSLVKKRQKMYEVYPFPKRDPTWNYGMCYSFSYFLHKAPASRTI